MWRRTASAPPPPHYKFAAQARHILTRPRSETLQAADWPFALHYCPSAYAKLESLYPPPALSIQNRKLSFFNPYLVKVVQIANKMWQFPIFKNVALLPPFLRALGFSQTTLDGPDPSMRLNRLPMGGLVTSAVATNLWVSSYMGEIASLQLSCLSKGEYSLTKVAVNDGSAPQPSWLTKNEYNDVVYCLNEDFAGPNGTIASYKPSANGVLTRIDIHNTIIGPVSSVVYNGGKALASAHYEGSAVTSWSVLPSGGLSPLQEFPFTMSAPGPDPSRQDAPHPHEVILDPTGSFIVSPDLGADLLRVFTIDNTTSLLTESTPFSVPPGSGPRHGTFLVSSYGITYFFLVSELGNLVASYEVTYGEGSLSFSPVFSSGVYGPEPTPEGAAVAETVLSPDHRFLLTSCRNVSTFDIPNFDPTNSTKIPSDTLQVWAIDQGTGKLTFKQLASAGGLFPRQFSVNKNGTLAVVGLQSDGRVVVIERDVSKGTFGDFVASILIDPYENSITSVIWDE